MLARLEAVLRRGNISEAKSDILKIAGLELDTRTRLVKRGVEILDLKPREYKILEYMMRNEGRVVTRTMLLEQVWGYHFDTHTNVIDVHISRLRRKIDEGHKIPLLHTVHGAGYLLGIKP